MANKFTVFSEVDLEDFEKGLTKLVNKIEQQPKFLLMVDIKFSTSYIDAGSRLKYSACIHHKTKD